MKSMKTFKIVLTALTAVLFAACYNDFDDPTPAKPYTDADIEAMGAEHISIADMKREYLSLIHI